MEHTAYYTSPVGNILIAATDKGLCGLWFENQKYYASSLRDFKEDKEDPVLKETVRWLDIYFKKEIPDFTPPLDMIGTPFQVRIWEELLTVPYGQTASYKDIAERVFCTSYRAVAQAVARNPVSIIVPCHRIIKADGSLSGYAGGPKIKRQLLQLENSFSCV